MPNNTTLPPEMLPRSPGAEVVIVCLSCGWHWVPEDKVCPNCGCGVDEGGMDERLRYLLARALYDSNVRAFADDHGHKFEDLPQWKDGMLKQFGPMADHAYQAITRAGYEIRKK